MNVNNAIHRPAPLTKGRLLVAHVGLLLILVFLFCFLHQQNWKGVCCVVAWTAKKYVEFAIRLHFKFLIWKRLPRFPSKLPKFSQIYIKKNFKSEISPLISQMMTKFVGKIRLLAMVWVFMAFLSMCIRDCLWLCSNLRFQILEDMLSTKWFLNLKGCWWITSKAFP